MPVKIKVFISVMALAVVGGFSLMNLNGGNETVGYVGLGLAALMVLAMWIFPETGKVRR
ncbi:MAG: hypothetical protein NWR87_05815 [Rhodospirillales bacterium]|jgi:hypothetical protein|nr:hypothetical protein [Rhodospirillales bacterium]